MYEIKSQSKNKQRAFVCWRLFVLKKNTTTHKCVLIHAQVHALFYSPPIVFHRIFSPFEFEFSSFARIWLFTSSVIIQFISGVCVPYVLAMCNIIMVIHEHSHLNYMCASVNFCCIQNQYGMHLNFHHHRMKYLEKLILIVAVVAALKMFGIFNWLNTYFYFITY